MRSRVELMGHSVHQMLIVFPLGLLATSVIFDLLALWLDNTQLSIAGHWAMAAGILGALLAAPFGTLDWLKIPAGTRAKRVGAAHGLGNVVVSALFVASWLLRDDSGAATNVSLTLALLAVALALVTAWLGGELVARLGMGVYDDAGLDAPSSLRSPRERDAPPQGGRVTGSR